MTDKTIQLEMKEAYVDVKVNESGLVNEKIISYNQLSSAFSNKTLYTSGILPGEYGVKYIRKTDNSTIVFYTEPAQTINYQFGEYDDDGEDEVSTYDSVAPILLWRVELFENEHTSTRLYALKTPIFTGKEYIYQAPFGNIYEGDQNICWGNNHIRIPSLQAIQGLSFSFFNAYENYDLSQDRIRHDGEMYNPRDLHEYISDNIQYNNMSEEEALECVHEMMQPLTVNMYKHRELDIWDAGEDRYDEVDVMTFDELIKY